MQNEESIKIVKRFFRILYKLQSLKIIKGKRTFTEKNNINLWNFIRLKKSRKEIFFKVLG